MDYVFGILVLITFITLIWCIVLSFQLANHNQTLKKHDRCARHFANRVTAIRKEHGDSSLDNISSDVEEILQETHGIATFLKKLCWVFVPFCVIISTLYLVTHFPRLINQVSCDEGQSSYAHLGIDYLGIIIALFAIIVTILVGWQIFNNMKERERLEQLERQNIKFRNSMNLFRKGVETKVNAAEDCCNKRQKEIAEINSKVEYLTSGTLLMTSAQNLIKSSRFTDSSRKTDNFLISMAYSSLFNATYNFIKGGTDKKNVLGCISSLKSCIMILSVDNLRFIKEQYDKANEWYKSIKSINPQPDNEILTELDDIHNDQVKIGWDTDFEQRRADFRKFQEWLDAENAHKEKEEDGTDNPQQA